MPKKADKNRAGLQKRVGKHYHTSSIHTGNKLDLLILTHDAAISAAKRRNRVELEKTLRVLIEGLDLEPMPHFALGLFKVYHQCQLAAKHHAFPEVIQLLSAHRAAWNEIRKGGEDI